MSLRHAILAFIDLEPATGYTLKQRFEGSVASFWSATQSQIYRELHELERLGLVEVEVVPQDGKPAKKVYALTEAGSAELATWRAAPVDPPQLRDPFMLKFVFAGEASGAELDVLIAHYARELERRRNEYRARLDRAEIFDLARSPREALLWRLSVENGLAWCDAQLAWAADARRRLARSDSRKRTPRCGRRR
jgi:DNA-binding PadR family transcriptional regulator